MRKFISGLILGAGASLRVGEPKQLLPFADTTLIGWVVRQAQRTLHLDEVIVVLGRSADEIRERVDFGDAKVIENLVFTEGCASSYRAGLAALDSHADAIMIILGDQPGITPEIIDSLAEDWRRSNAPIAICTYEGQNGRRKGHPMIFARSLFDELEVLHGDKAAWKLVDANASAVLEVDLALPFPEDINTREDFERIASAESTD